MKFRNLVVAAAGACLLALTSFAQITAIEGDVKGEDGSPGGKGRGQNRAHRHQRQLQV